MLQFCEECGCGGNKAIGRMHQMLMRFPLLATDYDGTLASDGKVSDKAIAALERLRASGRKIVLVTGRHLPDLCQVFPKLEMFDRVIVENGGLLYRPETHEEKLLTDVPNKKFVELLKQRGVPFALGRTIVATWEPHDAAVLASIRDLGLDLQVIFNKGAVMVLPSGVNKATGLKAALNELGISSHNVVAVGDAENDHSFMRASECSVAVANALASVKEQADIVLTKPRGDGVIELIDHLVTDDLAQFDSKLQRHSILLGTRIGEAGGDAHEQGDAREVLVAPRTSSILVAGPSGSGKSTAVSGILEQIVRHAYQFCLIDPEGDYEDFTDALSFGNAKEAPDVKEVLRALESPEQSVVVSLLGLRMENRASQFSALLAQIQEMRGRVSRPHWLILDEAHHLLPSSWSPANATVPQILENTILITVHPEHVAKSALNSVEVLVAIGKSPVSVFRSFAEATGIAAPECEDCELGIGEALVWFRKSKEKPVRVRTIKSTRERLRHVKQYAEGELSEHQSFYFRGAESKLNLRAQNLQVFLQLADGVDDETWMYHLRRGDYSKWFESMIKDPELKRQAEEVEKDTAVSAQDSRQRIREVIEARYTAPA